jgi:hypothetical protein
MNVSSLLKNHPTKMVYDLEFEYQGIGFFQKVKTWAKSIHPHCPKNTYLIDEEWTCIVLGICDGLRLVSWDYGLDLWVLILLVKKGKLKR